MSAAAWHAADLILRGLAAVRVAFGSAEVVEPVAVLFEGEGAFFERAFDAELELVRFVFFGCEGSALD